MYVRADLAMRHAFKGFGISYEEAWKIITEAENLNADQLAQREILLAAFNNIVEFSVAEEYQMYEEMEEAFEDMSEEFDDETDGDIEEVLSTLFSKYNDRYAWTEDLDIEYAMIVAAGLMSYKADTELMYMTMGDERVRPWHLQYEGFTAPKSQFPGWLIPPIEHGCRCYLVESDTTIIRSQVNDQIVRIPTMPEWFDRTFKESVALGGRIFSDEHPYFNVKQEDVNQLHLSYMNVRKRFVNE